MIQQKSLQRMINEMLVVFFLAGCSAPFTTPEPTSTPTLVPQTPPPTSTTTSILSTATATPGPPHFTTSGRITQDETWQGKIHVTGDITMANGAVLTIKPGTIVYIASNSDDQHCCPGGYDDEYTRTFNDPTRFESWNMNTVTIDGRGGVIQAVGTPDNLIVFRPEGDSTSPAQWDGVYIERGTIQYATLLYGGHTTIQALGNSVEDVEIAYNEVRHSLWVGIDAHRRGVWIHHNTIEGGGHQGIGVAGNSVVVEHNVILNCQTGVNLAGRNVIVRNNIIVDCTNGIAIDGANNTIVNNTIAWLNGPPDGWYYQNQLIYPRFLVSSGIIGSTYGPEYIYNNIVFGPYQWAIAYHGGEPSNGALVEYNIYWNTIEAYGGPGHTVISLNNSNLDPEFVDPLNGNFHLLLTSPAIDAGSPDLHDVDGSPSDPGAYGGPYGDW